MKTCNPGGVGKFHYGYIIIFCCCLMMGINVGLSFSCAGIFYEPVSQSLGIPVGEFGIYMSIMYVTSTLMLPLGGRMIERYSSRTLFTVSAALMGLTFLSMGFFSNVWEFYIAGGVMGVTLAFLLYLSYPTLVNRWFHTKVGFMTGICCAASGIGGMLFNPLAGWVISNYGWRWGYWIFGLIILVLVSPLLAILIRDTPAELGLKPYGAEEQVEAKQPEPEGTPYSVALRTPIFYGLVLFAFLMMGISTLNLFIPGYVVGNGFSLEEASLIAASVMGGVTIGKLALGWINDRNCTAGVLVTTLFGGAGLGIMLAGSHIFFLLLVGSFLFGWAYAGVTVQSVMLTRKVFGSHEFPRIFAVVSMALAAGGALASGGWGLIADATSVPTIFIIGIVALLLCLAIGIISLLYRKS